MIFAAAEYRLYQEDACDDDEDDAACFSRYSGIAVDNSYSKEREQ